MIRKAGVPQIQMDQQTPNKGTGRTSNEGMHELMSLSVCQEPDRSAQTIGLICAVDVARSETQPGR